MRYSKTEPESTSINSNEGPPGQLRRELDQVYKWAGANGYDLAADWIQLAALEPGSGVALVLKDDSGPVTPAKALEQALMRLETLATTFHCKKQVRIARRALADMEAQIKRVFEK
jgi:hypothetical protein